MTDARQLLDAYAKNGSEAAFRELVDGYIGLVYSTAFRMTGDRHVAEDIAQTVFTDLARAAGSLRSESTLGGWLHRHTCFVASKLLRGERRRQTRERQAMEMNTLYPEGDTDLRDAAPILDEAIEQLEPDDRKAIVLRFFEQCDFRTVGQTIGSSEDAARMRVNRALDKLALLLKSRGVTFPAAALGTALASNAVMAAPAGLAMVVSTGALTTVAATSTSSLFSIMAISKLHTAVAGALIVAGIATPIFVKQHNETTALRRQQASLQERLNELQPLREENLRLSNLVATLPQRPETDSELRSELLRLRGEVGRARLDSAALNELTTTLAKREDRTAEAFDAMSGILEKGLATAIAQQSNTVVRRISAMKDALNLTPDQESGLRELMVGSIEERFKLARAVWSRQISVEQHETAMLEAATAEENGMKALLTAEQLAAYESFKQTEALESARKAAESSASRMRENLKLTPQQEEQVYSVLYELNLKPTEYTRDYANVLDSPELIIRDQTARLESHLKALSGVLTAEQLSRYQEQQVQQISNAAAAIKFMQAFQVRSNRAALNQ